MASDRHLRRSSSTAAPSSPSETSTPTPTRIDGVIHPRLAALTKNRTVTSRVGPPPAQGRVRAGKEPLAGLPQLNGGPGGRGGGGGGWSAGSSAQATS